MRTRFFPLLMLQLALVPLITHSQGNRPYVVVLSMDGFRWDYPDSFYTPTLHHISKNGVKAESLIPVFPTVTFPNHYSMATGLYPDHHGIVHNIFYSPKLQRMYRYNDPLTANDSRFYGGEPIWVTAEKQHVKTASFYWVGSEASIQGVQPSYWEKYSKEVTFEQQIDTVIYWLTLPEDRRPHLIMFYSNQPDHLTHSVGPFTPEVQRIVHHLDSLLGIFLNKISHLTISNEVNVMLVSDHGMIAVNDTNKVVLDQYIQKDWCDHIAGHFPLVMLDGKHGMTDKVISSLSKAPHLKVWRKQDVPARFHFGLSPNIGDVVILADSPYSVTWNNEKVEVAGNHGYDNNNKDMHGIFYAIGPAFKTGHVQPSFLNVDIYPLIGYILNIAVPKTDGNLSNVNEMLLKF